MMQRHILITGCSGGGKSTLLKALREAGFATVSEPGRRVIAHQRAMGGTALPWLNMGAFLQEALKLAQQDLATAKTSGIVTFFDRGILDAALGLSHLSRAPLDTYLGPSFPYDAPVLLAPPWPEIYVQDEDRKQGISEAKAEYERISLALKTLNLSCITLPKSSVQTRTELIRNALDI